MKKSENVRRSESLHRKGTRLLTSCGLLQILRKYGEIRTLGSYHANLMMRGDVDFHVVREEGYTMNDVLRAFNEIALTGCFARHAIWNFDKKSKRTGRNRKGLRGYYAFFEVRSGRVKWKIDIWFLDAAEQAKEDRKKLNVLRMSVTTEQREAILAFKHLRDEAEISFPSQRIYELVLEKNMMSSVRFRLLLLKERLKQ